MAILNENEKKKLVNLGHLEVYTQETKKYIENQNITVDSHIADIDAQVQAEIINRAKADIEIESKISAETSRAELAEQGIKELVALEATQARQQENLIRQQLADSLSVEEENRNSAIYQAELRVDEKLASQYNVIGNDIATAQVAVEGKLTAATNNITNALSTEVQARTSITTLLQEQLTNEAALRVSEDNALRKSIDEHIVEYRLDSEALSSHIADLNNPHKVTPEQIGAASQEDFNLLERRVVTVETESQENIARLNTAESNIQTINTTLGEVKSDITDLTVNKVAYEGNNQTISGGLISDGDLRINGNLIVNGTTTTKDTETSLIKDNFIILNSEGETLGTQLSGISIRTNSKDAYSIAYDITNDSVSLGQGVISNDGNFSFNQGESKPILTRDVSTNLQDGHLLVWDAQKGY